MRLMRRQISALLMLCCMGVSTPIRAEELPPRPKVERPLPAGSVCRIGSVDQKCFTLEEWKDIGHIVLDYRALLDWSTRAETLYATQVVRVALTEAEAEVHKGVAESALAREEMAEAQVQAVKQERDEQQKRARRMGILAGVTTGAAVVLGAVVAGLALSR
jgi:hypothetical protein